MRGWCNKNILVEIGEIGISILPLCIYISLFNRISLFLLQTTELGGVPLLIRSSDMSNTIPDQKVTATFLTYLAAQLLDMSKEMRAARTIQLTWRKYAAKKREKELKVKYYT